MSLLSAGSAYITIGPSFTGFIAKVDSYLKANLRPYDLQIVPNLDLTGIKAQLAEVTKPEQVKVTADADTKAATAELDKAAHERKAPIKANADTATASAKIDFAARPRSATINVHADTGAAESKIAALGVASGGVGLVGGIAAASPLIAPLAAPLIGAGGALGGAALAAGGGGAIFGLAAAGQIMAMKKAQDQIAATTKSLGSLTKGTQAYKDKAAALASQQKAFNQTFGPAAKGLATFSKGWQSFLKLTQPVTVGVIGKLLTTVGQFLPKLAPVANAIGKVFSGLTGTLGKFLNGPQMKQLLDFFVKFGPGAIRQFAKIGGNLLLGLFQVFEAFGPLSKTIGDGLVKFSQGFADSTKNLGKNKGFQGFISYIKDNGPKVMSLLGSIVSIVGQFVVALAPVGSQLLSVISGFAKLIASAPTPVLLGVVVAIVALISPVAAVVLGVIALIGIFEHAYKTSDTFRGIVNTLRDDIVSFAKAALPKIQSVGEYFVSKWPQIKSALVATGSALKTFGEDVVKAVQVVWPKIQSVAEYFVSKWPQINEVLKGVWAAVKAFAGFVVAAFQTLVKVVSFVWEHFGSYIVSFLKSTFSNILSFLKGIFKVIQGVFEVFTGILHGNWSQVWQGIKDILSGAWTVIKSVLNQGWALIKFAFQSGGKIISLVWSKLWGAIKSVVSDVWNHGIKPVLTSIQNFLTGAFVKSFGAAVTAITSVWKGLEAAAAKPVNFIIGTVYNDGIRAALNLIPGVNLGEAKPIKFAVGGWGDVRGGGRIPGHGNTDSYPGMFMPKEFVFRQSVATKIERDHPGLLDRVNSGRPRPPGAGRFGDLEVLHGGEHPRFAVGGTLEGGDVIASTLSKLSTFVGRPYVWGGVGPSGFDCSGYQSVVTNLLRGAANPFFRLGSTASMPWSGFAPGPGTYSVGWTNNYGGSGIGHTAGTLAGVNVESRGGDGVVMGHAARGATDSGFTGMMHLTGLSGTADGSQYQGLSGAAGPGNGGGFLQTLSAIPGQISALYHDVTGMGSKFGPWGSLFGHAATSALDTAKSYVENKIKGFISGAAHTALSVVNPIGPVSGAAQAQAIARQMLPSYGWGPEQFTPLVSLWNGECVPLRTRILTRRGWVSHDEVQVGDETIGYNQETKQSEWATITAVHHPGVASTMRFGNQFWAVECTPNHRWLMESVGAAPGNTPSGRNYQRGTHGTCGEAVRSEGLVRLDERRSKHRVVLARPAGSGSGLPISVREAALLGWIAGDGSICEAGLRKAFSFRVHQAKTQHFAAIDDACADGGRVGKWTSTPPAAHHLPCQTWALGTSYSKDLLARSGHPRRDAVELVLAMSVEQRDAWLGAITSAEGTQEGSRVTIYQNDGPVADAVELAIYLSGKRPSRIKDTRGDGRAWAIGITSPTVGGPGRRSFAEPAAEQEVWCVTTTLGSWTAEQDGQVFLTGNSGWNVHATNPSSGAYGIPQCVGTDTLILTRRGWLKHDEVQVGDETLGYDRAQGHTRWTHITDVLHPGLGQLQRFGVSRWAATSTGNHRWLVEDMVNDKPTGERMLQLDEMNGRQHRVVTARPAETGDQGLPITVHEAALLGWIAGDGWTVEARVSLDRCGRRKYRPMTYYSMQVPGKRWDYFEALAQGDENLSRYERRDARRSGMCEWRFSAPYARGLTARAGGNPKRDAFAMVLAMSDAQRAAWLEAVVNCDGYFGPSCTQVSQKVGPIADAIILAIYMSGQRPSVSRDERSTNTVLTIGVTQPEIGMRLAETGAPFEAEVWCVTTELGTWTAMQDDDVFLTGNSLPASKMASAGADWRDNPATQERWGMGYIKSAYGSPSSALSAWLGRSPHWYAGGGWTGPALAGGALVKTPTVAMVGESGPELVLPPDITRAFMSDIRGTRQVGSLNGRGGGSDKQRIEIDFGGGKTLAGWMHGVAADEVAQAASHLSTLAGLNA